MIGFFIVKAFIGTTDSAGAKTKVSVESKMDSGVKAELYLPPYLRQNQCNISVNSIVYGITDDATGIGVAVFGENCDFGYFFDADITIRKSLTVTNDIKSTTGDVIATNISLKNHIHQIVEIPSQDCALIAASATSGIPAALTLTYTITPS